ncbi:MAG: hypothetical protein PF518_08430 [Spirochaetaceae bacterium]|jgi:phenylacetic acid degradation operon negative regulatory protein|nr:hypothetical protein [Spirochaetaceae bacterium]
MKESDLIYGIMVSLGKEEYSITYLKYLLGPFNISDSSLRTTLSRMMEKSLLKSRKKGKSVFYSFNTKGKKIGQNVSLSFVMPDWRDWDHTWWGYIYSLPSEEKALRHKVRKKLNAYRFVPLYPGCWIRPFNKSEGIEAGLSDLLCSSFGHLTKMDFITELSKDKIIDLWKIDLINDDFKKGLNTISRSLAILKDSKSGEAFYLKMITGNEIVQLLFKDPLLPDCYLPSDWQGAELRKSFFSWEKAVNEKAELFWNK